jgi:peptidoglycan/LPS O-acetylase OafA/YrhL
MSERLDGVQILRFVAAAMVLIQHAVFLPSVHYGVNTMPFRKLGIGTAGVYIFFVISGYVIAGLVNQPPLRFALHRIARIYPPYIASVVIGAALMILLGGITLEKVRWLWSFTLLPLGGAIDSWTYVPFWTLIYEMTFYAITMALMIFGRRTFDTGLVMWTALIFVAAKFYPPPPAVTANFLAILVSPLSLLFIAGAALRRAQEGQTWLLAAIGLIMSSSFWHGGPYLTIPVFALGSVGAIHLAVLGSEFVTRKTWLGPFIRGGDYSYGLYLIHAPIIGAMTLLGLTKAVSYPVAVVICLAVGGGLGILFGYADFHFYQRIARRSADRIASLGIANSMSDRQTRAPVEVPVKAAPSA